MSSYRVYPRVCGGTTLGGSKDPRVCGGTSAMPAAAAGLSPRVRGNRWTRMPTAAIPPTGLSPRVRGNLDVRQGIACALNCQRSIPACAGEPSLRSAIVSLIHRGLSPRVRGNQRNRHDGRPTRSIPACAGEPDRRFHHARLNGLSPRVRGNRLTAAAHQVYPRVCGGTSNVSTAGVPRHRSIPACAGEPGTAPYATYGYSCGLSPRVRGNPRSATA